MPTWLSGDGKRFWKQHAPKLRELGRLTALDQISFAIVCDSYAHLREMDQQIEQDGLTVEGSRGGQQPHPLLKARDTALKSFLEGCKTVRANSDFPRTVAERTEGGNPGPIRGLSGETGT